MKYMKNIYMMLAISLACMVGVSVSSCKDDIPADKYYTFTSEMMNEYLTNRPDSFGLFVDVIKKASQSSRGSNIMDLLSVYGRYTCFAPTNEAMMAFMEKHGYADVDAIPADICDTLARTHIVPNSVYLTEDLYGLSALPQLNLNDRYLQVKSYPIQVYNERDEAWEEDYNYIFNRSGEIIFESRNQEVENGVVQPVNAVLSASNQTMPDLLGENPEVSLFNLAMEATGIADDMRTKVRDESWNPDLYEDRSVYSGAQWDYCHIPENKYYKYTAFVCPDDILASKYGITDLESFYNYARGIYGGDDWATVQADPSKMRETNNPLRLLIGYNCLDRLGMYDQLTTICTIATEVVNPTEWYSTMAPLSTIKCERLTVSRYIGYGENDKRGDLYLNRGDMSRGDFNPGIHVNREVEYEQMGLNCIYYTTDGLADYGQATKESIFNTRMRIDLYTIFPEMMSNSVRDGRTTNKIADSNNPDISVTSPNYWFPNGYLDNVKINEDGVFLFQSQHNTYWSYEGDEFNLASDQGNYDLTFNLPSVPTGTYQIRLGFADMPSRGICQFYLDGEEQGTPFDMRDGGFVARTGWFDLASKTGAERESAKKNMHNMGWYHGPRSVFSLVGEGNLDGSNAARSYFSSNSHTVRYVLCTAHLDENIQHTMRIKSIWAQDGALVMIDYLELVPKSVFSVDEGTGKAEDDY